MKRVNVTLPDELHQWFKQESARTGLTVNALMQVALNNYYKEQSVLPLIPQLARELVERKQAEARAASGSR